MTEEVKQDPNGEAIVVKFTSGEEIIGRALGMKDGSLVMKDTFLVMVRVNPQNPSQIGFNIMPWSPLAGDLKNVNVNTIIFTAVPRDELLQSYNEATGGIVVPPKSLLVP